MFASEVIKKCNTMCVPNGCTLTSMYIGWCHTLGYINVHWVHALECICVHWATFSRGRCAETLVSIFSREMHGAVGELPLVVDAHGVRRHGRGPRMLQSTPAAGTSVHMVACARYRPTSCRRPTVYSGRMERGTAVLL